jgi:hypothetical protein
LNVLTRNDKAALAFLGVLVMIVLGWIAFVLLAPP